MTHSPTPKLNAMLVCDYVITEKGSDKKSLIGIFENISSLKFPFSHHGLTVYVKLTDAQGAYDIHLDLVVLKDDSLLASAKSPRAIQIGSPLNTHELVFRLRGLKFDHPGEYEFRIFANDKIFGQKTFRVVNTKNVKK